MAKRYKTLSATREDREVETKLLELKKELYRNEQLLRKTLLGYENLVARKTSILSSIHALCKFREEKRRNSFMHL